jgi:hypothetical protein
VTHALREVALLVALSVTSGCELVLGLEDHSLAPDAGVSRDGGTGGADASTQDGGAAGNSGTSSDAAGGLGGSGASVGGAGGIVDDSGMEADSGCLLCTIKNALFHRYRFDGSGTEVTDSVGVAHGTLMNTSLSDQGKLDLAGGTSDQYVDLPNQLVSTLSDATFEAWVTWSGGSGWQRIFDFGDSSVSEGTQGTGRSYLYLTPSTPGSTGVVRIVYRRTGSSTETSVYAARALAIDALSHVAVVVNSQNRTLYLYLDGELEGLTSPVGSLSEINDVNNWLGRSQFTVDPELGGSLHEFRIYNAALSDVQIAASFAEGPDPAFLEP